MFGFFFYSLLLYFDRQSLQAAGQAVNVNEQFLRPVFLNATVIFLFVLPLVTMRTYSEEKRSGTMELLLTAPLTDLQIILGKFLGAMGLYASMLARHVHPRRAALLVRQPRVDDRSSRPIWGCCSWAAASSRWACSSRA